MSIERQKLREELVAVIGAGRELSSEYDHALADLFLDLALQKPRTQPPSPRLDDVSRAMRIAIAAACLAVAALIFSLLALHDNHPDRTMNQPVLIPRMVDPDQSQGRSGQWWGGDGSGPAYQTPWSPSS